MTSQPDFIIRLAVEADVPAILACLAESFAPYRSDYSAEAFLDTVLSEKTLKHRMKRMTVFVASQMNNAEVIATIACEVIGPEEGHLRGMAVLPSWQGAGVAQRVLDRAEAELRARKCTRITLDTTAPLKRAMRFYERNGFRPSGRVTDFFSMPLFEYVKSLTE